jgi:hypothetical protein
MTCGIFYLFFVPLAYNYLREDGWLQDDDTQVQPSDKEEKEEDYILLKGVRKRRSKEE